MHNYGYEVDLPEETTTRPSRRPVTQTSARRVPSGGYRSAQDTADAQEIIDRLPRTSRKSRTQTTRQDYTAYYSAENNPYLTHDDDQIAPSLKPRPQYKPRRPQSSRRQMHWTVYIGAGMCSLLLLLCVTVHVYAWYINDIYQPSHYIQSSHLDTAVIKTPGHTIEGKAFVDPNNHLDMLIIPDGDVSKAKILRGPLITFSDPQAADLDIISQGDNTFVTTATGPMTTETFSASPHTVTFTKSQGGK